MAKRSPMSCFALLVLAVAPAPLAGCYGVGAKENAPPPAPRPGPSAPRPNQPAPRKPVVEPPPPGKGPSLVSLSAGAYLVRRPSEWGGYSAFNLIDETSNIWATEKGVTTPQTIVVALPEKTLLTTLEFDSGPTDLQFGGCSAKDVRVEMSDEGEDAGFREIARVSLEERTDGQRFRVSTEVPGRWVRLTVENNHGSDAVTELGEFRAYGTQLTSTPFPDVNGTYDVYYTGPLHLRHEGTSIVGCYESRRGLVEGGVEGHVFKFSWFEGNDPEPGQGVMVFSPDGREFVGYLYGAFGKARLILGKRTSDEVGSCGHWSGSAEEQLAKELDEAGRARVYGVNFDTDSDAIKEESKPTLDRIAGVLEAKAGLRITIEGHTDSTSTPEHNQQLSERRAQAVREYLRAAGIDASRLKAVGYGATKPVAGNDSELGRAQNRRVELLKL